MVRRVTKNSLVRRGLKKDIKKCLYDNSILKLVRKKEVKGLKCIKMPRLESCMWDVGEKLIENEENKEKYTAFWKIYWLYNWVSRQLLAPLLNVMQSRSILHSVSAYLNKDMFYYLIYLKVNFEVEKKKTN